MPLKFWSHPCCDPPGTTRAQEACPVCGKPGEWAGWAFERAESMARYQNLYGLKPIGPHRRLADGLFEEHKVRCVDCEGSGLEDRGPDEDWRICGLCSGAGVLLQLDEREFDAIRSAVLEKYPEAGVDRKIRDITSGPLIQDLGTGTIFDDAEVDPEDEGE